MAYAEALLSENFIQRKIMLSYAITFFIIALIAAVFGFWGVVGVAASIAKFLCLLFVILMVISLLKSGPRTRL